MDDEDDDDAKKAADEADEIVYGASFFHRLNFEMHVSDDCHHLHSELHACSQRKGKASLSVQE